MAEDAEELGQVQEQRQGGSAEVCTLMNMPFMAASTFMEAAAGPR